MAEEVYIVVNASKNQYPTATKNYSETRGHKIKCSVQKEANGNLEFSQASWFVEKGLS